MTSQKKIEKVIRKNRHRSFHPALDLLIHANQELALSRALASHGYGIEFVQPCDQAKIFQSSAAFEPGDLRRILLFAEIPGYGHGADARCGLRMEYYIPGKSLGSCSLTFARYLKEPGWVLEVKRMPRGPQPDEGILHALRRVQASFDDSRRVRDEEEVLKTNKQLLKDYHETVLIPRLAKQA